MSRKNNVTVTVWGTEYTVVAEESEEYIKSIAAAVDKEMEQVSSAFPRLSAAMVAVLAAINFCDSYTKAQQSADNLRAQIKAYLEDASKARAELNETKRQMAMMSNEIEALKRKNNAKKEEK